MRWGGGICGGRVVLVLVGVAVLSTFYHPLYSLQYNIKFKHIYVLYWTLISLFKAPSILKPLITFEKEPPSLA